MDKQLIDNTGDMLQAGLNFTYQESPEGKPLPPMLLMGKARDGKPGSSAHAEFAYHFQEFDNAIQVVAQKWQDIVTETQGNPMQGDMLTAYLEKDEWKNAVRSAYDASAVLKEILSDDSKAPKLIADMHLASLNDFRARAESLLGIEQGRGRVS